MKTLVHHARLISPGLEMPGGALLIEGGRIVSLHEAGDLPAADERIDAGGRWLLPGFIDIHAHGADGADVCDGSVEGIRHIAARKLQEGVTSWLPTTLTQPPARLREIFTACAEAMAGQDFCKMPGVHLEGPFINPLKAGAQNPAFVRPPDLAELRALHGIARIRLMSLAPEMPGALELTRAATALGIVCSAAHTAAGYEGIQAGKAAGIRHLTHYGNAMTPLHHRRIGAIGAGLLDDDLLLELICDGVHLSPEMLRLIFKCVPPERILMITDSVAASWREDGEMMLGGLAAEISGGVVRLKSNGGLAGSTLRFNDGLRKISELTGLPLERLVMAASWNQARSLSLGNVGKLEAGYAADFVVMEDCFSIRETWVDGRRRF